jgi:hypothetical protein
VSSDARYQGGAVFELAVMMDMHMFDQVAQVVVE